MSRHLTTGTPDANGRGANLVGRVRLNVTPGDPATPDDEADVILIVELSDVRESPALADYTGELELNVGLRVTDLLNGAESERGGDAHRSGGAGHGPLRGDHRPPRWEARAS